MKILTDHRKRVDNKLLISITSGVHLAFSRFPFQSMPRTFVPSQVVAVRSALRTSRLLGHLFFLLVEDGQRF